jgi:hypothetical protein
MRAQMRVTPTVPAYLWSGMPLFQRSHMIEYTPASTIWDALHQLTGTAGAASPLVASSFEQPEVVLAFTYDKLRADVMQQSAAHDAFKAAFSKAASSLTVPYVVSDGHAMPAGHAVCCSSAAAYLHESGVLSNGRTELITVNVDGATVENDRTIASLVEMVNEATHGKYVALLTANNTVPTDNLQLDYYAMPQQPEPAATRRRLTYAETQVQQIPLTPGILTGLLVGGLLIVIFINGFCCLFQLQTPKKFEHE